MSTMAGGGGNGSLNKKLPSPSPTPQIRATFFPLRESSAEKRPFLETAAEVKRPASPGRSYKRKSGDERTRRKNDEVKGAIKPTGDFSIFVFT